jgi:cell wall-associated NlpC family hydrolase
MTHRFVTAGALFFLATLVAGLPGCASLQPLPKFRTSSTSFAPDQLPLAKRPMSDLIDPTTVGAYSVVKQEAMRNPASDEDVRALVAENRSAEEPASFHADRIGLDTEALDDELAANDEFSAEEPDSDEALIQRVVSHSLASGMPVDDGVETNSAVNRVELMKEIINLLGVRYRYGGMDALRGLDCSAFVGTIYSRALGVRLPRSSNEQFTTGYKVRKDNLKVGDLVFFKTRRNRGPVSHVGIYVGQSLFAHASTKHGVMISTLSEGYYDRTYVGARRVLQPDLSEAGTR